MAIKFLIVLYFCFLLVWSFSSHANINWERPSLITIDTDMKRTELNRQNNNNTSEASVLNEEKSTNWAINKK